jgi:hypothetical protein
MRPVLVLSAALALGATACVVAQRQESTTPTAMPLPRSAGGASSHADREAGRETLSIAESAVSPKVIAGRKDEATVTFLATSARSAHVDVVDAGGAVVRRLEAPLDASGRGRASWDGLDDDAHAAPPGSYRYVIRAADAHGREIADDSARDTGGDELQVTDFIYDRDHGVLRFTLPQAGFVHLRVGVQGFPHLRTLLDWEPMPAGDHEIPWDGKDASERIALGDHPSAAIVLHAASMPWNTIILSGDRERAGADPRAPSYPPLARADAPYLHAQHGFDRCREIQARIELPSAEVSGVVPVRVVLDPADAARAVNGRFEIAIYEDLVSLFEEEDGTDPFTFMWDTSHLSPGEHLLTVNILSYDDHYGVATIPVLVKRATP